jgi:hypothetical protein
VYNKNIRLKSSRHRKETLLPLASPRIQRLAHDNKASYRSRHVSKHKQWNVYAILFFITRICNNANIEKSYRQIFIRKRVKNAGKSYGKWKMEDQFNTL